MAENWSVCIEVYGAEPGLAPYRYFNTFMVSLKYQMVSQGMSGICSEGKHVFVYLGRTLLTGSGCLQLWGNFDGERDEAKEEGNTEMTMRDSHSAWKCIWQSK